MTAREVAEAGGRIASCPVELIACLREICEPEGDRTNGACMEIRSELERKQWLRR